MCGKFAVVIGEVNLDCEHECHSELHPVHVIAIHVKDDPADDTWAFFARNWGNEGWCGDVQIALDVNPVRLMLPRPGVTGGALTAKVVASDQQRATLQSEVVNGQGLLLTMQLPPPEQEGWIVGELHVAWHDAQPMPAAQANRACGVQQPGRHVPGYKVDLVHGDEATEESYERAWDAMAPTDRAAYFSQLKSSYAALRPARPPADAGELSVDSAALPVIGAPPAATLLPAPSRRLAPAAGKTRLLAPTLCDTLGAAAPASCR